MAPPDGAGLGVAAGQDGAPLTVMLARESKISRFMGHGEEANRPGLFQERVRRASNGSSGITQARSTVVNSFEERRTSTLLRDNFSVSEGSCAATQPPSHGRVDKVIH